VVEEGFWAYELIISHLFVVGAKKERDSMTYPFWCTVQDQIHGSAANEFDRL
jgi:hypothetical protein